MQKGDELLAAVYDAPDDDAPRAVYADYLQERGDPLGELIALQLAPRTPRGMRREATLIKQHREAWLGPLWHVVNRTQIHFERGFVSAVRLRPKIPAKRLTAAIGDRRWTTVRALDMWGFKYADLLLHDVLRGVHRLESVQAPLAVALLVDERPRKVRSLEIAAEVTDELCEPLRAAVGLPELRHLAMEGRLADPAQLDWLWDSPLGRRLSSLAFPGMSAPPPAWRTSTAIPPNITTVEFGTGPLDIATLRRGPSGLLDQLEEPAR